MEVAFEQGGVYDLKKLLAAFDCRSALHERGCGGRVRVIQLLHQMTAFLCNYKKKKTVSKMKLKRNAKDSEALCLQTCVR